MQRESWVEVLVLVGLAAMVVGAYGPWVAHANAAMSLNALDLVEFVKFMTRAGLTYIMRELFYLPLLASAIGLALWSGRKFQALSLRLAVAANVMSVVSAALLALVALPPYPYALQVYRLPEDRLSFGMSVATLALIVIAMIVGRRVSRRFAAAALIVLALGSTLPSVWQFIRLSEPLAQLYGAPIQVGWGLMITVVGSLLLTVAGSLMLGANVRRTSQVRRT